MSGGQDGHRHAPECASRYPVPSIGTQADSQVAAAPNRLESMQSTCTMEPGPCAGSQVSETPLASPESLHSDAELPRECHRTATDVRRLSVGAAESSSPRRSLRTSWTVDVLSSDSGSGRELAC